MTTDLVAVGNDVALIYAFEAPELTGSARHDVCSVAGVFFGSFALANHP